MYKSLYYFPHSFFNSRQNCLRKAEVCQQEWSCIFCGAAHWQWLDLQAQMKVWGCRPVRCSCDKHICCVKGHWRTNKKPLNLNQRHTFLVSKLWVSLWEEWNLDSKHQTISSHHMDRQICYFIGNSYSVVALVHLRLKFSSNSSQLPFIWFSLICGREWELEESQVSTKRSDNECADLGK